MVVAKELSIFLFFCSISTKSYSLSLTQQQNYRCDPDRIYNEKNLTCACSSNGVWLNKECQTYFNSNEDECNPDTYKFVDCNVCVCGSDGRINKNRCTKHDCNSRNSRRSNSVTTCHLNTFYTLAPCQFCYCVNKHKLVCNAKQRTQKVVLGKFELTQCSGNVLQELTDLLPEKPVRSYKTSKKDKSKSAKSSKATTVLDIGANVKSIEDIIGTSSEVQKDMKIRSKKKRSKEEKFARNKMESSNSNPDWNDYSKDKHKKKKVFKKPRVLHRGIEPDSEAAVKQKDIDKDGNLLTIDLPYVIDKVLNMVLRKSMVSLKSGNNCTPGSSLKDSCNKCFCLNNGKMICTKNKCK